MISSLDNKKVKEWTKLHNKKYRQDEYLILDEDNVRLAYECNYLKTLIYCGDRPFEFKAPEGGETFAQLCDRIESFIKDLTAREDLMDKNVMLSCHGCSSRALLYMMGTERVPEKFWRGCVPPNLSISTVDYINGKFEFVDLDHIYYDRKEWKNSYAR